MKRHYLFLMMMSALTLGSVKAEEQAPATTASPAPVNSEPNSVTPGPESLVPGQIEVTPRAVAVEKARAGAGRAEPFSEIRDFKRFPSHLANMAAMENEGKEGKSGKEHKGKGSKSAGPDMKIPTGLVPPPPPGVGNFSPDGNPLDMSLPTSELPMPPSKPSIADKLKLVGIIENKAIFTFTDSSLRRLNKWPKTLALAPGEQFETVSVSSVTPDTVTLTEDGERTVKELSRVK